MYLALGKLIRERREAKGLSRTKFAEFCNISPNSMVKYEMAGTETGKYPSSKSLVKICEVLELDPRDAFDAIQIGEEREYHKENPIPKDAIPYDDYPRMRFKEFFATDLEALQWRIPYTDMKGLSDVLGDYSVELHFMGEQLKRLEWRSEGKDPKEEYAREKAELKAQIVESKKKNGPDLKDPSHSEISNSVTGVVEATPTKSSKGEPDEAV